MRFQNLKKHPSTSSTKGAVKTQHRANKKSTKYFHPPSQCISHLACTEPGHSNQMIWMRYKPHLEKTYLRSSEKAGTPKWRFCKDEFLDFISGSIFRFQALVLTAAVETFFPSSKRMSVAGWCLLVTEHL